MVYIHVWWTLFGVSVFENCRVKQVCMCVCMHCKFLTSCASPSVKRVLDYKCLYSMSTMNRIVKRPDTHRQTSEHRTFGIFSLSSKELLDAITLQTVQCNHNIEYILSHLKWITKKRKTSSNINNKQSSTRLFHSNRKIKRFIYPTTKNDYFFFLFRSVAKLLSIETKTKKKNNERNCD